MQRINFQKKLEETIKSEAAAGHVPRLLLHSCCAPCSSYVLEYLSDYFSITLLYYNPNISPQKEYEERIRELSTTVAQRDRTIAELREKLDNLTRFVDGTVFAALPEDERELLVGQRDAMGVYAQHLHNRIAKFFE